MNEVNQSPLTSVSPRLSRIASLRQSAAFFARNEEGTVTIFAVMMLMMMMMVGGIGVDLMRNEMERTRLQNTIDRAVLAAADLDQTLDPTAVVNDYFDKAGMSDYLTSVTVDEGLNYRTVNARARTVSPTRFMTLMGLEELPVPARSAAEERISNVEISMVLDISGSMGWNNKMDNLHDAAKTFVDTVIREETEDLISISLIPYTAQVDAGEDIFDKLLVNQTHDWSHCIDFDETDFDQAGLSFTKVYTHMQHFDNGYSFNGNSSVNAISNPGCPKQSFEDIMLFSQNAEQLKNRIDDYRARANTAIHLGMKWGVATLDPSFRTINIGLAQEGKLDNTFAGRPSNYNDPDTLKTIILMTDGENVDTYRIDDDVYAVPNHWTFWSRYPLNWYLNNYVPSWQHNSWKYKKYSWEQADIMLDRICDAAKAEGIVVWTVGFEVSNRSAGVMQDCASTPSHFFRVEGVEITDAFEAIASQINQLRLTQ